MTSFIIYVSSGCPTIQVLRMDFGDLLVDLDLNCSDGGSRSYSFYDLSRLEELKRIPYSLRVLLECAIRNYEKKNPQDRNLWKHGIDAILNKKSSPMFFSPGRVLLQDFTGVPALIDLAALREVSGNKDLDSSCPADLVVDHTVQIDYSVIANACKEKATAPPLAFQPTPINTPTILVHSTFPPPCTCHHPPYHHMAAAPPLLSPIPAFYPVSQYQQIPKYGCPPSSVPQSMENYSSSDDKSPPNDNPGLPIQDEICPFHQRLSHWAEMLRRTEENEFERNRERFHFLKWIDKSFKNITVIPPGTGAMHQVNLEYLARVVISQDNILFPDTVVGTDTHTTMINGLGVLGWGVGMLDAQSVMFGHPVTLNKPKVIGVRIDGDVSDYSTSTDIVLMITKRLRQAGVQGTFVEFYGSGIKNLSIADRATIANMCPEYGALVGFFPVDEITIKYLAQTGRDKSSIETIEKYLKSAKLFANHDPEEDGLIEFDSVIEIDLADVTPCVSGPKRTKDKIQVSDLGNDFKKSLTAPIGPKGYGLSNEQVYISLPVNIDGSLYSIQNGSVLLAAISSCTNTSNPSVMLGAGILARKAVEAGLSVPKVVKTSLSPGSGVVTAYLQESGVMPYLYMLGFEVVGYGCSICADNSKPSLPVSIVDAIKQGNLVCCGLLSGNRNFEGRIDPDIKANYLASPLLVIAYALAGTVKINFDQEPIGYNSSTNAPVFLRDIWPSRKEIQEVERRYVIPSIFRQVYSRVSYGNKYWNGLEVPENSSNFPWDSQSTYIKIPSFVSQLRLDNKLSNMRCLLKLGDDVTSDHISPAGSIARHSPAADYLLSLGLTPREFSSYGARRGNHDVMVRGTFYNTKLKNALASKMGPYTLHFPSGVQTTIYEAAMRYKNDGVSLIIVGGKNFGRGTSRDWATRGPQLLAVKAICAVSFDPTYRSNCIKTGILPLEISIEDYNSLKGTEIFDIEISDIQPGCLLNININSSTNNILAKCRLDNSYEVELFNDGGVINQKLKCH